MNSKIINNILLILLLTLSTIPIFFQTYQGALKYHTSRDPYENYVLHLLHGTPRLPGAPYAYRLFSVAIAIPFYYLPPIKFSNLPENITTTYIKAVQALSIVSYLSIIFTAVIIYILSRRRLKQSFLSSIVVALISILFSGFISKAGVDPIGIFIIALLLLVIEKPIFFLVLIIASVGFNEKIPLTFLLFFLTRFVYCMVKSNESFKRRYLFYLGATSLALCLYILVRIFIKIPGEEHQTDIFAWGANFVHTARFSFSLKGIYLNIVPILILAIIYFLRYRTFNDSKTNTFPFFSTDILIPVGLFFMACLADVTYNTGRIVMYSYPIFLVHLAFFLDKNFTAE